jgi:hypothetical protein
MSPLQLDGQYLKSIGKTLFAVVLCGASRAGSQQLDNRPLGAESDRLPGRLQALGYTGIFEL